MEYFSIEFSARELKNVNFVLPFALKKWIYMCQKRNLLELAYNTSYRLVGRTLIEKSALYAEILQKIKKKLDYSVNPKVSRTLFVRI